MTAMVKNKSLFRIFFTSQGKGYEIYARRVDQSEMHGFVEIRDIVFGEKSSIVVDPTEESLKKEFGSVKRVLVPFHAVNRIDEVEKEGTSRVLSLAGGDPPAPASPFSPPGGTPGKG